MNQVRSSTFRPMEGAGLILMLVLIATTATKPTDAKLNSVLNINETFPYLIDGNNSGRIIEPRDYMDFDNLYSPNDTYKAQQTVQGRNYYMLKAFDFANYFQADYWHYSNEDDLKRSASPVADESKCAQQLDWLERQIIGGNGSTTNSNLYKPGEQHIQLASYVDAFGRPEASTYLGHGYWLGSYYQCNLVSIDMDKYELEACNSNNNSSNNRVCPNSTATKVTPTPPERLIKTRYCVGKAREVDWPEDNYVPRISYKVGLCLPETCQTLSIARHRLQLEKLMRFNMPDHVRSRITLNDMYCLPDKRSPIREFSLSARIFLALIGAWLAASLVATSLYSCLRRHQKDLHYLAHQMRNVDLTAPATTNTKTTFMNNQQQQQLDSPNNIPLEQRQQQQQQQQLTIDATDGTAATDQCSPTSQNNLVNYIIQQASQHGANIMSKSAPVSPSLLIIQPQSKHDEATGDADSTRIESAKLNRNQLAIEGMASGELDNHSMSSCNSSSSFLAAWLKGSPYLIRALQAMSITENMREFQEPPKMLRDPRSSLRLRINLNALDAIKCLCCILVVFGHIVFIHMQHLTNIVHTIELSNEIAPRILIAFFNFVDTFFIISGMLTTYFIFKRFNKRSFANPIIWLYISLLRLVRLSPVYLLVFWFAKTITVHLSDGPLWDYGTDKNSIKGLCQNDHWWKSLLYLGNVGTMQPLCILPAWSIIIDAQYSLFIPPLLFLIFRHKRLGYVGLLIAVIISTANMSYQLATQTAVKTSDMAKIRLHVYPLISRFAAEFYNTAWNRLGPIAVGILGGHMLYLYDIGHIRRWPYYMRGAYFKFILILHMLIFILPTIGRLTDNPEAPASKAAAESEPDMAVFIMSNATIKPIWSIINTIFLLRLITDLRMTSVMARLMSHNIWHCLGKLCFASYLIHYEIILILLKSRQDDLMDPNWWNVAREFSLAFLISAIVAYFIYILFEAPINKLIMLNIDKSHLVKDQSSSQSKRIILSVPANGNNNNNDSNNNNNNKTDSTLAGDEHLDDDETEDDATGDYSIQISDTPSVANNNDNIGGCRLPLATSNNSAHNHLQQDYRYECLHDKRTKEELANMA